MRNYKSYVAVVAYIFFVLLIAIALLKLVSTVKNQGYEITIENQSNQLIQGLRIKYANNNIGVDVPSIATKSIIKVKVPPKEEFGETSIILEYTDKSEFKRKETIIGYVDKGFGGNVKVIILDLDNNGILKLKSDI